MFDERVTQVETEANQMMNTVEFRHVTYVNVRAAFQEATRWHVTWHYHIESLTNLNVLFHFPDRNDVRTFQPCAVLHPNPQSCSIPILRQPLHSTGKPGGSRSKPKILYYANPAISFEVDGDYHRAWGTTLPAVDCRWREGVLPVTHQWCNAATSEWRTLSQECQVNAAAACCQSSSIEYVPVSVRLSAAQHSTLYATLPTTQRDRCSALWNRAVGGPVSAFFKLTNIQTLPFSPLWISTRVITALAPTFWTVTRAELKTKKNNSLSTECSVSTFSYYISTVSARNI